jgi:hypothetical protein
VLELELVSEVEGVEEVEDEESDFVLLEDPRLSVL